MVSETKADRPPDIANTSTLKIGKEGTRLPKNSSRSSGLAPIEPSCNLSDPVYEDTKNSALESAGHGNGLSRSPSFKQGDSSTTKENTPDSTSDSQDHTGDSSDTSADGQSLIIPDAIKAATVATAEAATGGSVASRHHSEIGPSSNRRLSASDVIDRNLSASASNDNEILASSAYPPFAGASCDPVKNAKVMREEQFFSACIQHAIPPVEDTLEIQASPFYTKTKEGLSLLIKIRPVLAIADLGSQVLCLMCTTRGGRGLDNVRGTEKEQQLIRFVNRDHPPFHQLKGGRGFHEPLTLLRGYARAESLIRLNIVTIKKTEWVRGREEVLDQESFARLLDLTFRSWHRIGIVGFRKRQEAETAPAGAMDRHAGYQRSSMPRGRRPAQDLPGSQYNRRRSASPRDREAREYRRRSPPRQRPIRHHGTHDEQLVGPSRGMQQMPPMSRQQQDWGTSSRRQDANHSRADPPSIQRRQTQGRQQHQMNPHTPAMTGRQRKVHRDISSQIGSVGTGDQEPHTQSHHEVVVNQGISVHPSRARSIQENISGASRDLHTTMGENMVLAINEDGPAGETDVQRPRSGDDSDVEEDIQDPDNAADQSRPTLTATPSSVAPAPPRKGVITTIADQLKVQGLNGTSELNGTTARKI